MSGGENSEDNAGEGDEAVILLTPQKKALMNPLILQHIYFFLPRGDKKIFRIVCKTWWNAVLDQFRKNIMFWLADPPDDHSVKASLEKFYNFFSSNPEALKFLQLKEKPFRYIRIIHDGLLLFPRVNPDGSVKDLTTYANFFWEVMGPSLETLEICMNWDYRSGKLGEPFLAAIKLVLLKYCPNLKELEINQYARPLPHEFKLCPVQEPTLKMEDVTPFLLGAATENKNLQELRLTGEAKGFGFPEDAELKVKMARDILELMPNLKSLDFDSISFKEDFDTPDAFIPALKFPMKNGQHIKLDSIDISGDLINCSPDLREYIKIVQPEIKELSIKSRLNLEREFADYKVPGIILDCKDSLTDLWLELDDNFNFERFYSELSGQMFPNLETFKVDIDLQVDDETNEDGRLEILKFDLRALRGMPKLKKFDLTYYITNSKDLLGNPKLTGKDLEYVGPLLQDWHKEFGAHQTRKGSVDVFEKLEEFSLHGIEASEVAFMRIKMLMPNLRRIRCIADERTLKLVLELWPGLQRFDFDNEDNEVSDEMILQIEASSKIKIKKKKKLSEETVYY